MSSVLIDNASIVTSEKKFYLEKKNNMEATELTNKTEIDETERWAGPGKGVTLALYFWPLHI